MKSLYAAAIAAWLLIHGSAGFAEPQEPIVNLKIEASSMEQALNEFAQQTGLQLVFPAEEVTQGLSVRPLSGAFTPSAALGRLLADSGLYYRFVNANTVAIRAKSSDAAPEAKTSREVGKNQDGFRLAQGTQSEGTSGAGEAATDTKLEEVVVTAQKKRERERDVPTSMTVLSAEKLQAQGMSQLSDYAKQVPGLRLIGAAGPGQGMTVLRGMSTGSDRISVVGLYLDDVPFTPSSVRTTASGVSFDPDLVDIDHIEVLKGPQSTLYGASALGGLIKFVTKRPDLNEFEGSVRVNGSQVDGAGSGFGGRVSVNVPIMTERVGMRVSAFYRKDPGFVDDAFHGESDLNSDIVKGGRFSLLAKVSDNLETTLSGILQDIDIDGPYGVLLNSTNFQPSRGDLVAYPSPIRQPISARYRSLSDTTVLNMSFASLTNIASYARASWDSTSDISLFAAFALGGIPPAPAGTTVSFHGAVRSERYGDELRLASSPGRFEWMLGGFYTDEKDTVPQEERGADSTGTLLPSSSPYYNYYTFLNRDSFRESAVFGDATYHFTDQVEGTIGARYSRNNQDFNIATTGLLGVNPPGFIGFPTSDSATNYLATASYKPVPTLMLYVRAASAYRPGGANSLNSDQRARGAPPSFGADTLWNYETGIKGSAWGQRLTYSAAVYHIDWSDIQINVLANGFSTIGNAAKAKNDGAEFSLDWVPVRGLTLGLSGAYNNARISTDAPRIFALKGNPLPYSPKVSTSATIDYRAPLSNGMTSTAGLTSVYYTEQVTGFQNGTYYRLSPYGTLDVRGGVEWNKYSLIATLNNVTNRYALTNVAALSVPGSALVGTVIRPRTLGLSFEARF